MNTNDFTAAELEKAIEAVRAYDIGSSRGALMPLDAAARASLANPEARRALEDRLLALLREPVPVAGKAYLCGLLGMMGAATSAPALGECLKVEALSQAARGALEAMPCPEAGRVLRQQLPALPGPLQRGVIHSLGRRRETESVEALAALLPQADNQTRDAVAAALGSIGSTPAVKGLLQMLEQSSQEVSVHLADACLTVAQRLSQEGRKAEATDLCRQLAAKPIPKPARQALQRLLPA